MVKVCHSTTHQQHCFMLLPSRDLLLRGDLVGALLLSFLADLALDLLALLPLLFLGFVASNSSNVAQGHQRKRKKIGLKFRGLHWSIDPLKPSNWKLHWSMDDSLKGGPSIACPAWPSERVRPLPWPGRRGWRPHLWWNRPATESPRWPPVVWCFFAAKHHKTTTFKEVNQLNVYWC